MAVGMLKSVRVSLLERWTAVSQHIMSWIPACTGSVLNKLWRRCRPYCSNKTSGITSVFSHLAASEDAAEDAFTKHQSATFKHAACKLKRLSMILLQGIFPIPAAIFRNPALQYDMVRLGIGLYGIDSIQEKQPGLQTAATLKTTIAQLRK